MKIAVAQLNPIVGDLKGNVAKLRVAHKTAADQQADLLMTSELFISGYPPEDLVLRTAFMDAVQVIMKELAETTKESNTAILLGTPWRQRKKLYNAALLLEKGEITHYHFKEELPNYGVFDEQRVFVAGENSLPIRFRGHTLGVMVCEDMWLPAVTRQLVERGAQVMLVLNGSPYAQGKLTIREHHAAARVKEAGVPLIYVNQVGGQDELVFDGQSFALSATGEKVFQAPAWREGLHFLTLTDGALLPDQPLETSVVDERADMYQALVTGVRDYVRKNGFKSVVLGLSGGVDSALVAAIAVDALGADNVLAVMMPSSYTSNESLQDAKDVANNLNLELKDIPLTVGMAALEKMLAPHFKDRPSDLTEENLQSRLRGVTLMALSNKLGHLLLTTGNKSEMAVGYATLYGDMNGSFNPLKDVYKTDVYALCKWRNQDQVVIPENILTKAPTAELRPGQKDQDSLPPYEVLDEILKLLVEEAWGVDVIAEKGYEKALVVDIFEKLKRAEYKRYQAPPGVKITAKGFGRDWRYPLTNLYQED